VNSPFAVPTTIGTVELFRVPELKVMTTETDLKQQQDDLVTAATIAELAKVSEKTALRLGEAHLTPIHLGSRLVRFRRSEVLEFLKLTPEIHV
jgi:predicted DNA-binding transcriptional regulator AlpA